MAEASRGSRGAHAFEPPKRARPLLGKYMELEARVDVAGLAVNGHPWKLLTSDIDKALIVLEHHLFLTLEIPTIIEHVDHYLGPLMLQLQRRLSVEGE